MGRAAPGAAGEPPGIFWPLDFAGGVTGSMTGLENSRFVARIESGDDEVKSAL